MKQKVKNEESKRRILQAVLEEFGKRDYDSATLNNICKEHNISKGLIYYYFGGKDELFLICVKKCFDEMSSFLKESVMMNVDGRKSIKSYFYSRNKFFKENKEFRQIFKSAMFQTPEHLKEKICKLHKGLDEFNREFAKSIFYKLDLREGITAQEAMDYFIIYEEFFNEYFRRQQMNFKDSEELIEFQENIIYKIFDRMLYGIAIQEETL